MSGGLSGLNSDQDLQLLKKYFPELTQSQIEKFSKLPELYSYWNERINVISRKDIENLFVHHILHSLSIAKFISFTEGTKIMDVGTGGGFPGIPLAIIFPNCEFTLVDSIGKKIKVVEEVAKGIELKNVNPVNSRMEEVETKADFIVSRAVAPVVTQLYWTQNQIQPGSNNVLRNGWIFLKGGDLSDELREAKVKDFLEKDISDYFSEGFFEDKKILYIGK